MVSTQPENVVRLGATKAEKPAKNKPSDARPTRALPTDRIAFPKQLALLRGYGIASGKERAPVKTKAVADLVGLSAETASLANAFFLDTGLLAKAEARFVPSDEVMAFCRAHEWEKDTAAVKLAPKLDGTWFARAILPRLEMSGQITETEALRLLSDAAEAPPKYKVRLVTILDYLDAAGLLKRTPDGMIRRVNIADGATFGEPIIIEGTANMESEEETELPVHPSYKMYGGGTIVGTAFSSPMAGSVQFRINVDVDMTEFSGWDPARISAFFAGIAQVLAAKAAVEKQASSE